jgi:hypothetical protein
MIIDPAQMIEERIEQLKKAIVDADNEIDQKVRKAKD